MAEMKHYTLGEYVKLLEEKGMLAEYDLQGKDGEEIKLLTYDSREVTQGTLFICKGAHFTVDYLLSALDEGAFAYVSEVKYEEAKDTPYILVKGIRDAMAVLANFFYNKPWEDLAVIGFGGTKGKSTSTYYMKAVVDDYLAAQDKPESAVISTIDIYDGKSKVESHITTPEAV